MAKKNFKLYYTSSEVAEALGEEVATIYYWERAYDVKLPISKSGNKRYREEELNLMRIIRYLVRERKLTSKGVKEALRSGNFEGLTRHAEALLNLRRAADVLGEMISVMDKYRQQSIRRKVLSQSAIIEDSDDDKVPK